MNGVEKLVGIITEAWSIPPDVIATDDDRRALISIAADLDALFRSRDATRRFIGEPAAMLGGASPKDAIAAGRVAQVQQFVELISGRRATKEQGMISYAEIKAGDKLRITGMGAPGFAKLGDVVTVVSTNGKDRCGVRHDETGDEVFFALTCGAQRLEKIETQSK